MKDIRRRCALHIPEHIYVGKRLSEVPPRSLVIMPVRDSLLCCGLAGMVAVKGAADPDDDLVNVIARGFARMVDHSLDAVSEGQISPADYLGGRDTLGELNRALLGLKQDPLQQYRLREEGRLERLKDLAQDVTSFLQDQEHLLEQRGHEFASADLETLSGYLVILKDIAWGLREDLVSNQVKIWELIGDCETVSPEMFTRFERINLILNSLDRLEVRGRDSTGIRIAFAIEDDQDMALCRERLQAAGLVDDFVRRTTPGDLLSGSIDMGPHDIAFTYKTASVTGELGRNCREIRKALRHDDILRIFAGCLDAREVYLSHTRWASVGAINETNCHPVNAHAVSSTGKKTYPRYGEGHWCLNVALNGDIDNYQTLRADCESRDVHLDAAVTTDTKVIPMQVEKYLLAGHDLAEAFRLALNDFEGSHAIALESNLEPGKVFLALHGSGQTIYVGLSDHQYLFASEVYGIVEETPRFIKMDGEREHIPGESSSRGQIFTLDGAKGPGLAGITARAYNGQDINLTENDVQTAEITTRDIDRGDHPHFLIKEILDAPQSIRKTLRGKYHIREEEGAAKVQFNLGDEVFPARTREALARGDIGTIYVIGQGTAAVAGKAISEALSIYLRGTSVRVEAKTASDLSGFFLEDDLSDTLIIAVTQSGTTTDTNRAVTMAHERGAHLIAVVNRRQSDITTKVDGVYYTSDGRDIEMSVASTKAFYSQIVAGYVLALNTAQILGSIDDARIAHDLRSLEKAPHLMRRVIARRDQIKNAAWDVVRRKKYWAVVGSGTNKVASDEVRIKLSELCYKTISSDIIEDKKHIDLSAEPLIVVLAAGSPALVLEDIVKDTAIFKAHASSVVVVADEGETRFDGIADAVINVPRSSFPLSVILNTLVGHIWGYYAARSLDKLSGDFRDFRQNLQNLNARQRKDNLDVYESVGDREMRRIINDFSGGYRRRCNDGELATLTVGTAADLTLLLKYASGRMPLEDYWEEFEDRRTSSSPVEMLDTVLGRAIDELARPIDAIRHQAKTVTVGTSRKVEVLSGPLFDLLAELDFSVENLRARDGFTLKRLQQAVSSVKGYTLYRVAGLDDEGLPDDESTIAIERRGGRAMEMHSRFEQPGPLMGTKRTIVRTGNVYAGTGRSDGAPLIIVPLLGAEHVIDQLLLLHVDFRDDISVDGKRELLGDKGADIINFVNERNLEWQDAFLAEIPIEVLLGEPADLIAEAIVAGAGAE